MSRLRLGSRGSALARIQAQWVAEALDGAEVVTVRTADADVGDKARFVSGIETAILAGEVEIGVHSAKDLPGELPDGLALVGVPGREDPTDALVGPAGALDDLPEGARVGTSSLRRRSQLLALRPDLEIAELRGNVDTRLGRLEAGDYDAIVLATAGLARLGRAGEIAFRFALDELTPAPGQGCLALEAAAGDEVAAGAAGAISDRAALAELTAERAAVRAMGASCDTPVGVCARFDRRRARRDRLRRLAGGRLVGARPRGGRSGPAGGARRRPRRADARRRRPRDPRRPRRRR